MAPMSVSDVIQLIGVLASLIIGIASIFIAVFTLRQNAKMIKDSVRPYIVIYFDVVNYGSPHGVFILKNFGQTAAHITKFIYDDKLAEIEKESQYNMAFSHVEGIFFAPGQSVRLPLYEYSASGDYAFNFEIEYKSSTDTYSEKFSIYAGNQNHIPVLKNVSREGSVKNISYTLQEMSDRQL